MLLQLITLARRNRSLIPSGYLKRVSLRRDMFALLLVLITLKYNRIPLSRQLMRKYWRVALKSPCAHIVKAVT